MATETVKRCDVFGTLNDVRRVSVIVEDIEDEDAAKPVVTIQLDLCPKAIERLKKFIARGTTPPTAKAK